jgi:hypothetical protein
VVVGHSVLNSLDILTDWGLIIIMFVVKRDGRREPVHFDKITARITKLSYGLNTDFCDPVSRACCWIVE